MMRARTKAAMIAGPALLLAAALGARVAHAGPFYPSGASGYDIAGGQCGQQPPGSFGVVAATNGRAFTDNSCLASEFAAAVTLATPPSLYMNLNAAIGSTASAGLSGPKGTCKRTDKACIAYNYGYNAAADAVSYAQSQGARTSLWWIDVETSNSWQKSTALNQQSVQGALDYLEQRAGVAAGVYSTALQWDAITGGMQLAIPNWVAGARSAATAPSLCSSPFSGASASVWLAQYPNGTFDGDYAC